MVWTKEKLVQFPEPYRDFMLMLKPVIDTRKPGTILRISAIPLGRHYGAFLEEYDYSPEQTQELAENLRGARYIDVDSLGFVVPTPEGEELIRAFAGEKETRNGLVPPLPALRSRERGKARSALVGAQGCRIRYGFFVSHVAEDEADVFN